MIGKDEGQTQTLLIIIIILLLGNAFLTYKNSELREEINITKGGCW